MVYLSNRLKKLFYLLFSLGTAFLLFSPDLQKKPLQWISVPVGSAVYYMQIGTDSFFNRLRSVWDDYLHLVDVEGRNRQLRRTIAFLEGENNALREKSLLANRLMKLLNYQEHSKIHATAAAVIGRKPSQWFDTILINKGESDGIAVDMGVIIPQGVVGKVVHTGAHYSQVLLASDRNSAISATVQRTREQGIVQGDDAGSARLKYLPHDSKIDIGDQLITSGLEGSFSKGLIIGRVAEISGREEEMFLKIKIIYEIDLDRIEEVLIIQSIQDQR
ncbi:MAG: rod shape-determining protein MreC [Nitrospiria bacterium]